MIDAIGSSISPHLWVSRLSILAFAAIYFDTNQIWNSRAARCIGYLYDIIEEVHKLHKDVATIHIDIGKWKWPIMLCTKATPVIMEPRSWRRRHIYMTFHITHEWSRIWTLNNDSWMIQTNMVLITCWSNIPSLDRNSGPHTRDV